MQHYDLLWLMVPAICSILFVALFCIWRQQPDLTYIRDWALGYLAGTIGYLINMCRPLFGDAVSPPANIFFALAVFFTALGLCRRYAGAVPVRILLVIYLACEAAALYFSFASTSIIARGTAISIGMAAMLLVASCAVFRATGRDRLDIALGLFTVLVVVAILARPAVILATEGDQFVGGDIRSTFWATSHSLIATISWLGFAVLFCTRLATDLIGRLQELSSTDPLTTLLNRRGFEDGIGRRTGSLSPMRPGVLLLVDIDRFKSINDTFGHAAGDGVIKGVADAIRAFVPDHALVARLGGEEFGVYLDDCPVQVVRLFAEGARQAIAAQRFDDLPDGKSVTVSIGAYSIDGGAISDWHARADAALYEAKSGGRNRVVVAENPTITACAA